MCNTFGYCLCFFFIKQKTAYDMRISDWSSDVCSSDLLYADIKEDGDIGPATLGAFRAYLKARGAEASEVMMKALNSLQGARYIELSRTRAANEAFTFGRSEEHTSELQ